MDSEIDLAKLRVMRKRIMDLERLNAYTNQYTQKQIQKMIKDIIEEVASDDN